LDDSALEVANIIDFGGFYECWSSLVLERERANIWMPKLVHGFVEAEPVDRLPGHVAKHVEDQLLIGELSLVMFQVV
jgi:hypothetical protein